MHQTHAWETIVRAFACNCTIKCKGLSGARCLHAGSIRRAETEASLQSHLAASCTPASVPDSPVAAPRTPLRTMAARQPVAPRPEPVPDADTGPVLSPTLALAYEAYNEDNSVQNDGLDWIDCRLPRRRQGE